MKKNVDHNKIRSFGVFSTLFLSLVGFGVFTYTQNIGKILGRNGVIPTIIYGIIYLIFIFMIYKTIRLNDNNEFEIIVENLFGKVIGRILLFLISIGLIFLISIQLRIFIDSIKVYIFPNINSEFMVIITLLICYYVVRFGDKVIPGLNEIMVVFLSIFCLIVLGIVYKNIDLSNMLPMEVKDSYTYFKGFLLLGSYFVGSIMLYYLLPKYQTEKSKKIHIGYKATIMAFIFLSVVFLICVGILNINQVSKSIWPIIMAFTTVDVPGGFIERVEGLIITIAIVFFIINFINLYFYSSYLNSKSLGINNHSISSTAFIPIIYALSVIPNGLEEINFILSNWVFPVSLILVFGLPILMFILTYIRKGLSNKGGKS